MKTIQYWKIHTFLQAAPLRPFFVFHVVPFYPLYSLSLPHLYKVKLKALVLFFFQAHMAYIWRASINLSRSQANHFLMYDYDTFRYNWLEGQVTTHLDAVEKKANPSVNWKIWLPKKYVIADMKYRRDLE